jgi:hypothetical protein
LKEALEKFTGISKDQTILTDVYNHRIYKFFEQEDCLDEIYDRDVVVGYEVPISVQDKERYTIVPFIHGKLINSVYMTGFRTLFGTPSLLVLPKVSHFQEIADAVMKKMPMGRVSLIDKQQELQSRNVRLEITDVFGIQTILLLKEDIWVDFTEFHSPVIIALYW